MDLSSLNAPAGARKNKKRIGRGDSSGHGGTAGKGHKGQKARSGGKVRIGFEGGQMPLSRRLPKRGFHNPFRKEFLPVNIRDLCRKFKKGDVIDGEALFEAGIIRKRGERFKILAKGEIDFPVTLKVANISQAAKNKITAAGGVVEEVM